MKRKFKMALLTIKSKLFKLSDEDNLFLEEYGFDSVSEDHVFQVLKNKWLEINWFFFAIAVLLTIVNQIGNFF